MPDEASFKSARDPFARHPVQGFQSLVRSEPRAALAAVGIPVPRGVQVDYAADPAAALSLALDRPTHEPGDGSLDDAELLEVVGGRALAPAMAEIDAFLERLRPPRR